MLKLASNMMWILHSETHLSWEIMLLFFLPPSCSCSMLKMSHGLGIHNYTRFCLCPKQAEDEFVRNRGRLMSFWVLCDSEGRGDKENIEHTHTHTHAHTHMHTHIHTHICILTHTHTHARTHMHTHMHTHTHTHTHMHTHTHTHSHTLTHTHCDEISDNLMILLIWIVKNVLLICLCWNLSNCLSYVNK